MNTINADKLNFIVKSNGNFDTSSSYQAEFEFNNFCHRNKDKNLYHENFKWHSQRSSIGQIVSQLLVGNESVFRQYNAKTACIYTQNIFVFISSEDAYGDNENTSRPTYIYVWSTLKNTVDWFRSRYGIDKNRIFVNWHYRSSYGNLQKEVELIQENDVMDIHYPYIIPSIKEYQKNYLESKSPILICVGEPGTGKTSFIRNMIIDNKLCAHVTYDEGVLNSEDFFIEFLTGQDDNILVIEDADLLLSSREKNQNKLMSKLLNISDGLIKLFNKKIIFTTNLTNLNDVDSALLRNGRCHDVLYFRSLTPTEANVIAENQNIDLQIRRSEYTLADIFGHKENKLTSTKTGFI